MRAASRFMALAVAVFLAVWPITGISQTPGQQMHHAAAGDRPMNILLIVADDMGFSDLGSFGGDASTPNLDRLAAGGLRLTNFHAAPSCSPSRAQLLSSADNHLVGLGNMRELLFMYPWQQGQPGYEGYLTRKALTIARVLSDHGYRTYMAGKWHMGEQAGFLPSARGFDRSFALMGGTSSHYAADNGRPGHPTLFMENGREVRWPPGKYSTDHYTDKLLEYLETDEDDGRPFFAYLAYTAPHHPLHAPQSAIERYDGVFDSGYEALMARRLLRMRELGILADRDVEVFPHPMVRGWETLSAGERRLQSRLMQVHAAMLDNMDQNVGRILEHLRSRDQLENTLIVFLSDNGASSQELATFPIWKEKYASSNNAPDNIGREDSWAGIGAGWASAVTAPSRLSKHHPSEGGIRVPAVLWRSDLHSSGRISNAFTQIRDIAPTLLDYARITLSPGYFEQRGAIPWAGRSLMPLMEGLQEHVHAGDSVFAWEHREQFGLIKGDWKLLRMPKPYGTGDWELIDLANDPGETENLSDRHPGKVSELLTDWTQFVEQNNVILRK